MASERYLFDSFLLDPHERRLLRDGEPVELNARYLDALVLLVREPGRLISKSRFNETIWRGAPVTDEALTQCIRTLRRSLGDEPGRPRFIETVPKHGYRFIAAVERTTVDLPSRMDRSTAGVGSAPETSIWRAARRGALGGAAAGLPVGVFYGLAGAPSALDGGMGATSVLLVLVALVATLGALAGSAVAWGAAAASRRRDA